MSQMAGKSAPARLPTSFCLRLPFPPDDPHHGNNHQQYDHAGSDFGG